MKTIRFYHWLPRILCICAILFISMFSFDVFSTEHPIWYQIGDLMMHLIPSFVLLGLLILAWKKEYLGGIIFMVIGLGLSPFVFNMNYAMNHSVWMSLGVILSITIPFIVIGVLFIISHFKKKKSNLS